MTQRQKVSSSQAEPPAQAEEMSADTPAPAAQPVTARREQFLIARNTGPQPMSLAPLDFNQLEQVLRNEAEIDYKRTLQPRGHNRLFALLASGTPEPPSIIVAAMDPARAAALSQDPRLIVERDHPLFYSQPSPAPFPATHNPGVLMPYGAQISFSIRVTGDDNTPVQGAHVYLYGSQFPAQGETDANGTVQLSLIGETPATLRALYVSPKADYWERWVTSPRLDPNQPNLVALTPLDQTFPNFPGQQVMGWGLQAMKVDKLPPTYRGQGVKIAEIDSGVATTHQDLKQPTQGGFDITQQSDQTWSQDVVAHGSHCAGVIVGSDNARGIRGVAPDATLYAYKIFPGGQFSDLIEALDRCIEQEVDLINLSLGSDERSQLIEQKLYQARQLGIACIVAAGNSSGPVQYPAASPNVLAVAAIGKQGTYPQDTYHSMQVFSDGLGGVGGDGYFSARFSCFGPEVGICGPGVAILSSVPPDNYLAMDGTSMAAPHITGLAALILAHHPDFQGPYRARNAARVDRLFAILKQSAQPPLATNIQRIGAGLPDALRAFQLAAPAAPQPPVGGQPDMNEWLRNLLLALQQANAGNGAAATPAAAPAPISPQAVEDTVRASLVITAALREAGIV